HRSDLPDHPDYVSNPQRIRNETRLDELLNAEFATQSRDHWLACLRDAGVPCAPINTVKDAFGQDLVAERELVQQASHVSLGDIPSLASPMRLSATPAAAPEGAPLLGQHTEQVLREIGGLGADRIAALAADGTIVHHPEC
ncbi:MAG: CoA transferase, partial [Candidatus Tectomicrobia bacterium]|nr:CoA transferase [Candidatus Tectomicrobia bacterium]